ncbi:MAG TPA: D-sedoheptulose 7-phosphate isomerase [Phnomibacter sp.]|nr:D-sedoheptulose 7-phosphate isomerase [Phnomibacter sp.]
MLQTIQQAISESIATKQALLASELLLTTTQQVAEAMIAALKANRHIYFCGNGGSAADAQHLAAELSGAFYNRGRRALPAEALHTNSSYLTAVANDYGYDYVFARLVEGIMQPGDILIGLSTSGNSPNVVKAFEAAQHSGVITVGLTGAGGGAMASLSQYLLNVPSQDTPRIQEMHMLLGHTLCQLVEFELFTKHT